MKSYHRHFQFVQFTGWRGQVKSWAEPVYHHVYHDRRTFQTKSGDGRVYLTLQVHQQIEQGLLDLLRLPHDMQRDLWEKFKCVR